MENWPWFNIFSYFQTFLILWLRLILAAVKLQNTFYIFDDLKWVQFRFFPVSVLVLLYLSILSCISLQPPSSTAFSRTYYLLLPFHRFTHPLWKQYPTTREFFFVLRHVLLSCVCVCVCLWKREVGEKKRVCVFEWEREGACANKWVWERERVRVNEKEWMRKSERMRERESMFRVREIVFTWLQLDGTWKKGTVNILDLWASSYLPSSSRTCLHCKRKLEKKFFFGKDNKKKKQSKPFAYCCKCCFRKKGINNAFDGG